MIQIQHERTWGVSDFAATEGRIISGSGNCVWCEQANTTGEFVIVVQENGRSEEFAMHIECLPPEVKRVRISLVRVRQVQHDHALPRA